MEKYQVRKISFNELIRISDWYIKIYTITQNSGFNLIDTYKAAKAKLINWLEMNNT